MHGLINKVEERNIDYARASAWDFTFSVHASVLLAHGPVIALQNAVAIRPDWAAVSDTFSAMCARLLSHSNMSSYVEAMELYPAGRLQATFPASWPNARPSGPGVEAALRTDMQWTAHHPSDVALSGLGADRMRAIAAVYVPGVDDANATFGIPGGAPLLRRSCDVMPCYIAETRSKLWGWVAVVINTSALTGATGRLDGLCYTLSWHDAVLENTTVVAQSASPPTNPHVLTIPTKTGEWTMSFDTKDGWRPLWEIPAMAATAVFGLAFSLLVAGVSYSYRQHVALLGGILPKRVIDVVKNGEKYVQHIEDVAVVFADVVGYTEMSTRLTPEQVAGVLDALYTAYDKSCDELDVYRCDIIGDAYMAVAGVQEKEADLGTNVIKAVRLALSLVEKTEAFTTPEGVKISARVGVHCGPVVATVIGGTRAPKYTLLGDTVNTASRMESMSQPMRVHVSESVVPLIWGAPFFKITERGEINVKGKGRMLTFWVEASDRSVTRCSTGWQEWRSISNHVGGLLNVRCSDDGF